MTPADLHAAIEATLGEVPCPAVDIAYTIAVRDALRARLPGATLDVYFKPLELVVLAVLGGAQARMVIPLG